MRLLRRPTIGLLLSCVFLLSFCTPVQPDGAIHEDTSPTESMALEENLIDGTQWRLISYGNLDDLQAAADEDYPTLSFHRDTLEGSTGCNNYGSEYRTSGQSLSLVDLFWTEKECLGQGLMKQETAYLALLSSVETYKMDDDSLILSSPNGILQFGPIVSTAERSLVRRLWRLETIVEQNGSEVFAERVDERFLITAWFEDRRIGGQTGCNNYSAPYETNGEGLNLSAGPMEMTAAGCIDEASASLEGRFTAGLQTAESYHIDKDRLTIIFPGGELIFVAQEEVSADENAVYTSLLREWDGGQGLYVILDHSQINRPGATLEETMTFVSEQLAVTDADDLFALDPTTLLDFEQKNAVLGSMNEILNVGYPVTFIANEELDEIFSDGKRSSWEVFHERYPDSQGIFTFSRVGFNKAGDQALVYLGIQTEDITAGYYSLLVEREGRWSSTITFMIWGPSEEN